MLVKIEMLAFLTSKRFRLVGIPLPAEEAKKTPLLKVLELVFKYGQNHIQSRTDCYSTSVGDVIDLFGEYYVVAGCGFKQISSKELREYKKLKVEERYWKYVDSEDFVK